MAIVDVLGLHPVEVAEPCYLIEIMVSGSNGRFDIGAITQTDPELPPSDWQVPYAEKLLTPAGDAELWDLWHGDGDLEMWSGDVRVAFSMHHLDPRRPLVTPFGEVPLPAPTARPPRLEIIEYEEP